MLHIGQVESAHCSCILAPSPRRNRCRVFINICRVDYFCKPLEVLHPTPSARHMICLIIPEWSDPAAELEEGEHAADHDDHQDAGEHGGPGVAGKG